MDCEKARLYYYDYTNQKDSVPSEVRSHLEQCSVCRDGMERLGGILEQDEPAQKPYRPRNLEIHYELLNQWLSCGSIKPFLPLLLIPEMAVKHRTPVTAHIEKCPACQKDQKAISSLRLSSLKLMRVARYLAGGPMTETELSRHAGEVLSRIKDRNPSAILTRMCLEHANNLDQKWISDSVVVDVEYRRSKPVLERWLPQRRSIPAWISSGIAAAILLIVLLTILPTQNVGAVDLAQIYANLESVQNVHIRMFDDSEELQNIWIAEGLQIRLIESEEDVVFWDQPSERVFRKHQGAVELISQGSEMELERPWGLLPFKHISDLPASHDWDYISDAVLEGGLQVQIYELSWKVKRGNNTVIEKKWRGYLDIHSHLPYRAEWLDKVDGEKYQTIMILDVSYPADAECLKAVEDYGFQRVSYGNQDEFFNTFPEESIVGTTEEGFFLST